MLKRTLTIGSLALIGLLTGAPAMAQRGLERPPDSRTFGASIVAIDRQDRTITVRFQKNEKMDTYPVAKNAEFYYFDGAMDIPKSFGDLTVGDTVKLEFGGVKGAPTLSKVTSNKEQVYEVDRR